KNPAVAALSVPPLIFTIVFKIFIGLYLQPVSVSMELDNLSEGEEEDEADEEFLQTAHNSYIDDACVPGLFALSIDDPSDDENKETRENEPEESTGSQSPKHTEAKKLVEPDSSETPM
ncbi:hypothetical protein, partial [Salmonella sp. s51933]|uniref:hypothetical protein n=1 Tax=Salmonella sp. s51933 TaxID=3160127 RepID=UPI0037551FB2